MQNRTTRLLTMLQVLRERRMPVTAIELAQRFDISDRTIYRDIDTLRQLGALIEGEAGVGFTLRPGFFLPPLGLSELEADALQLGLRFVARRADPELAAAARATLGKIAAAIDPATEHRMRTNGLAVGPPECDETLKIGTVRNAMARERKLGFSYRTAAGVDSQRIVWPVALGFFADSDVMVAWCETREAFRHFRLDRVQSLHTLEDGFPQ